MLQIYVTHSSTRRLCFIIIMYVNVLQTSVTLLLQTSSLYKEECIKFDSQWFKDSQQNPDIDFVSFEDYLQSEN
jgi:hypothetical protein